MKIYLPHIHYTLYVKPRKAYKGKTLITAKAVTSRLDGRTSVIYIDNPHRANVVGLLSHELVHVLGFIREARHIDFIDESEHMAYTMQYLIGKIRGLEYE